MNSTTPVVVNFSPDEQTDTAKLEWDELTKELLVKADGLLEINGALGILQTAVANRGITECLLYRSVSSGPYAAEQGSGGRCYTRSNAVGVGERGTTPFRWIGSVSAGDKFQLYAWRTSGTVTTSVELRKGSINAKLTEV